ncbi:alpha/beta-hydrolase [Pyrenochaeta sp. DS3sAY3a]|nr:alpha/beta-hydrolase [Pyrenochaeta sp. DS3sAY3a]
MRQTDIQAPQLTRGSGYSLLYSLYLHCVAYLLRQAVTLFTGTGSLFTKHGYIDTPGLGNGRVKYAVCIPKHFEQPGKSLPIILVFEGGGFILGQPSDGERNDRLLSEELNAVVLSVEYAKSPRYPFPHALLQVYQVLQWCLSPGGESELGVAIDPSRVAFLGNSAGGNLAASLSLLTAFKTGPCAKFRDGLPKTYRQVAQVLLYPSTACHQLYRLRFANSPSEVQAQSIPVWVAELMEGSYLPPVVDKRQIFIGPLLADVELLEELRSNIAPVACFLAGLDCLRGEAMQYCQKLEEAGVQVRVKEYAEAIHGFSHYPEGHKKYRKNDVVDCWEGILRFLEKSFTAQTPGGST